MNQTLSAQVSESKSLSDTSCDNILPEPHWTELEKWSWNNLCKSSIVILPYSEKPLDKPGIFDLNILKSNLSGQFMYDILMKEPFRSVLNSRNIAFFGAHFPDDVNLSFLSLSNDLFFLNCIFNKSLIINGAKINGSLFIVQNSNINETLQMEGGVIENSLYLESSVFRKLLLNNIHVKNRIILRNIIVNDETGLKNAVAQEIFFNGSLFRKLTALSGIHARIFSAEHSIFNKELRLNLIRVKDALLNFIIMRGPINIRFSTIDGNLTLFDSTLKSVDLRGTYIGAGFILSTERTNPPKWDNDAELNLDNLYVRMIMGDNNAWPKILRLQGLDFKYFGKVKQKKFDDNSNQKKNVSLGNELDWYINWIEKDKRYTFQVYKKVASYLIGQGEQDIANGLIYRGKEREREMSTNIKWLFLTLQKIMIGYGIGLRYFYSLYWVVCLTILGWAILYFSGEYKQHTNNNSPIKLGFGYSFDMLLPIIQLREVYYKIDLNIAWVRVYFGIHKIMGYVLISFVLAGLSGITKQ